MNDIFLHITYQDNPVMIIFWTLSIGSLLVNLFLRRFDPPVVVERNIRLREMIKEIREKAHQMPKKDLKQSLMYLIELFSELQDVPELEESQDEEKELSELEKWRAKAGADVAFYGRKEKSKNKPKTLQKGAKLESVQY